MRSIQGNAIALSGPPLSRLLYDACPDVDNAFNIATLQMAMLTRRAVVGHLFVLYFALRRRMLVGIVKDFEEV